jgi:hypothetical protein
MLSLPCLEPVMEWFEAKVKANTITNNIKNTLFIITRMRQKHSKNKNTGLKTTLLAP